MDRTLPRPATAAAAAAAASPRPHRRLRFLAHLTPRPACRRVKRQRDLLEALSRAGGVVAGGFALQRLLLISEGAALGA